MYPFRKNSLILCCSLQFPTSAAQWITIALDFQDRSNFPHCLGTVDGNHVQITAPSGSGSYYFNYKKLLMSF
nr:unnamed protein product [Callosobruchus analis]